MSGSKRDILRRVPVFRDLADDEIDAVGAVLKARRGAAGDVLFREGDRGDSLVLVLDGLVAVRVRTNAGTDEEVARLGPGEVVGEMAFIDAEPRSATVSTIGGATVLEFTRESLAVLYRDAPRTAAAIQRNVLAGITRRLRDAGVKLAADVAPKSIRATLPDTPKSRRGVSVDDLRAMPALAGYAHEDLELLSYVATVRPFARGAALMEEGSAGDACFLVVQGSVAITRGAHAAPLATLGAGALVGQLALLDRAQRAATVTAREDVIALEVRADAFANLVRAHSPIALRFQLQVALAGVRQLRVATRALAASTKSAVEEPANSLRMIDDWDDGDTGPSLELAVDPASLRR